MMFCVKNTKNPLTINDRRYNGASFLIVGNWLQEVLMVHDIFNFWGFQVTGVTPKYPSHVLSITARFFYIAINNGPLMGDSW